MKAAEKVPEDAYSFTPATTIRPFGALVAHVADAQLGMCSTVNGERKQGSAAYEDSKADIGGGAEGIVRRLRQSL